MVIVMRRTFTAGALLVAGALLAGEAEARPVGPQAFCQAYPTSPACGVGLIECTYCHVKSEAPVTWNPYGEALRTALGGASLTDDAFRAALPDALAAVADLDSDGDGTPNEQEIFGGTLPGDATSLPSQATCPADPTKYDVHVCQIDYRYLLKKLSIDFCGYTPTMEELDAIRAADVDTAKATIDATLDACMRTEHFRGPDGVLWRLAHRKIKPLSSIKSGANPGVIPLADYDADYALFVYTQIDGHDARDLLTANYFVERTPPAADGGVSTYAQVPSLGGQAVVADRRAGMATTAWFLVTNVMFTALPRTAAAQLYRAYLGHDIARQEGLFPVPNEPKDYDAKGVSSPTCAACHSTLDPLAYPYRNYNGLGDGGRGKYIPSRIEKYFATDAPNITQIPEAGALFGKPEADLVSLAADAAASEDFAAATVMDYWLLTFGAPPDAAQSAEFASLVASLESNGYSVAAMLHDLVKTEAYGTP
jgi:hypothetical protein